jgi:peptidoglycan/LPS O-acetylase OafA/YrhL
MTIPSIAITSDHSRHARLEEVDALRGLAALSVMFFHYLDRHEDVIGHATEPLIWFPWGFHGVQLFFVISGFVIFMTLERTRSAMDFIVSRFARLYPAYWAAMYFTLAAILLSGVPHHEPKSLTQVLLNLTMWQSLFGVPHVEGAYWTLYVELWFYVSMLALFVTGRLRQIELWLLVALVGTWVWWLGILLYGEFGWSFRLSRTFNRVIPQIPFFVTGICIYRLYREKRASALLLMLLAVFTVAIQLGWFDAVVCALAVGAFLLILTGRAGFLRSAPLVWFGTISYSLYLLHNYAGRSLMAVVQASGWSANASILLVTPLVIGAAALLTYTIERPAQRAIRSWWSRRRNAGQPSIAG